MTRLIDLTMPIREGMANHPFHGRTPVFLSGTLRHELYQYMDRRNPYDGGKISFRNEMIQMCGHTGTHMDAPAHGSAVTPYAMEQVPLDRGYGPAIWLDLSHLCGPGVEVTADDLREAEERGGARVRPDDIVLVHTGWSAWSETDPAKYLKEHMGLTQEAADWLRARGARTVGIDCATTETIRGAYTSPVHMNFLRPESLGLPFDKYIAIIENLANVHQIPKRRFLFVGVPLPFVGQTGSPIRAFAVSEEGQL